MTDASAYDILIKRDALAQTQLAPHAVTPEPADGHVTAKIDAFALTANNVTYAAYGEAMAYWQFFPVSDDKKDFGRVPVWGFAQVIASAHPGIAVGERLYGYWPMGTHLDLEPTRVGPSGFVDATPHRAGLAAAYNRYSRVANAPGYRADAEDLQMLFQPLFATSFLLDDFFAENNSFGATRVFLSSASSKTAIGLAHLLHRRGGHTVVGLTSPGNVAFCESLGCYDTVVAYDAISEIEPTTRAIYADFAGAAGVTNPLHELLGDNLAYSCRIGAAHWDAGADTPPSAGPKREFFFAPEYMRQRAEIWGPGGFEKRLAAAWTPFIDTAKTWLKVEHSAGPDAVQSVWRDLVANRVDPRIGYVLAP